MYSLHRGQKGPFNTFSKNPENVEKNPQIWFKMRFSKKKNILANLKYINSCDMMKKKLSSLYNFRTYFFPLSEVEVSFSNLITRTNHTFIKPNLSLFC